VNTAASSSAPTLRRRATHFNITVRTAVLTWLVATGTLLIFALAIVPEQKRTYLENLRSKAHGITVSLRDVAAGAVVNEDFSSVVDHCSEMLKGDDSIAYIILTRNDGFSLVHDRTGWRNETLSGRWLPTARTPSAGIEVVPLFKRRVFNLSQPLDYSGIEWGWIHVGLTLDAYDRNVASVKRRTLLFGVTSILLGLAGSIFYAKHLVRPILALQEVVRRVAGGDLSARAAVGRSDELGLLAQSVNAMTEALVRRDRTLNEANETLEQRVHDRTRELQEQIAEKERAHRELNETQRRLMQLSREAGMAEVATGVLHNVGNVLNSVNVSAAVLRDTVAASELPQLRRAADLLRTHAADLPGFFAGDPRAQLLPRFLDELAAQLAAEHARLATELSGLTQNIEHIKEIVAMQQSYASAAAVVEQIDPAEVFAQALNIQRASLDRGHVRVHRDFPPDLPTLATDRHNVLQILTNFVANSIHATAVNPPDRREITAQILPRADGTLAFTVRDNGVGIAPENFPHLFTLGFTTRKNGHGFGLHAGALAARALGGTIDFASDGPGTGASFTLLLPLRPPPTRLPHRP
jgi:signal transduction histidine kinase